MQSLHAQKNGLLEKERTVDVLILKKLRDYNKHFLISMQKK